MSEEKQKILECPKCKDGNLEKTGVVLDSMPALYGHKCDKCDYACNIFEEDLLEQL